MDTVGWIGTGRMGQELCARLLRAGRDVAVWNRTRAKADPLVDLGAVLAGTPAELAGRDVVLTMVSSSDVFERVTLGEGGLLSRPDAAPGVLVDASTISAAASARVAVACAERGTALLAAPVSGNPKVARAGRLSVVVSGPRDAYERVAPLLGLLGRHVTWVGEGDQARLAKIAHNLLLGVVAQCLAETLVLVERGGLSRADYLAFLNDSVLGSVFTRYKSPALVSLDFTPTFTSHLLRKDFELGLDAARELDVQLPVSALVHQLVVELSHSDLAELDFASLLVRQARAAGIRLAAEDREVADGLDPLDEVGGEPAS